MKDYKNIDEFMDDLETKATARKGASQLCEDYFTLKQWYEEQIWQREDAMPWEVSRTCINEMRNILHALSDSELKSLADSHDRLAQAVYAKRCTMLVPRVEYHGDVAKFISNLASKLDESENA